MLLKEPIFICSLARSGTHWLQRSIAQSHELINIGGADLILRLQELLEWYSTLYNSQKSIWSRQNFEPSLFIKHLSYFYKNLLQTLSHGQRFIENSAEWNAICIKLINQMFPDAFYLLMYRDGRNYVASMEKFCFLKDKEFDFEMSCKRWARIMDDFKEIKDNGIIKNYMLIRFEDLLVNFDEIFEKVCTFVNIQKFKPEPLIPNSAFINNHNVEDYNNRWKKMSKEKRRLLKKYAGAQLIDWGYVESNERW